MTGERITALLVHGMGADPGAWDPLRAPLRSAGVGPRPLRLPSLEMSGPEGWCEAVRRTLARYRQVGTCGLAGPSHGLPRIRSTCNPGLSVASSGARILMNRGRAEPRASNGETANDRARIILIGHSLGAAVCLHVARRYPVDLLVMLACPTFWPDFEPDPPPHSGLSDAALERAAEFLKRVCASSARVRAPAVHFVGLQDRWVPASQARRLPVPLVVVPGAGHGLVRSALFRRLLIRRLLPRG